MELQIQVISDAIQIGLLAAIFATLIVKK